MLNDFIRVLNCVNIWVNLKSVEWRQRNAAVCTKMNSLSQKCCTNLENWIKSAYLDLLQRCQHFDAKRYCESQLCDESNRKKASENRWNKTIIFVRCVKNAVRAPCVGDRYQTRLNLSLTVNQLYDVISSFFEFVIYRKSQNTHEI